MRHGISGRKLTMTSAHRRALFRNLATSLILHGELRTTVSKAKDLKRVVERLITRATKDSLSNRRLAYAYLLDKDAVHKLYTDLGPRYRGVPGGYTRVVRTGYRHGDAAEMAVVQLVQQKAAPETQTKKPKRASRKAKSASAPAEAQTA